jgi:hypothetical protein
MTRGIVLLFLAALCAATVGAQADRGTIKGRVRLAAAPPGNPIIRMGVDPMCSQMNAGKRVVQEIVSADQQGNLANVFVRLRGAFPETPVPSQPVTIDQRTCLYTPRVIGVRVGQTLQVRNGDPVAHSVHSVSKGGNSFSVTTPSGGTAFSFKPKREEVMLRVSCDLHKWMTTYVGVVTNPYFAVSGQGGAFDIDKVPPGTYTIEAWQEEYGVVMKTVKVIAGGTATVDFTYSGSERPSGRGR